MPDTTAASFAFLSWVRQGLAAVSEGDRLPIRLRVTGNTTREFPVPARLYGPGDVIGLDPREVVRTEPVALSTEAEPNYFPLIEFDHPGLPWMFSPEASDGAERLHPWLCLATVRQDACQDAPCLGPGVPLPVLTCPASELPNPAEAWAWAHAQVAYIGTSDDLEVPLRDPVRSVSRLLSPRRLDAQTSYYACLVPVYEVGRKAGLGEPITPEDEETLRYAWESDAPAVRLPVYYHWEFRTGEREDFEALATRIEPRSLPDTLGQRPLDINEPGWTLELPPGTREPVLGLEGALRTRDAVSTPWPAEERTPFQGELRRILNAPADQASAEGVEAPIVTPPIYGQWYPGVTRVPEELGEPRWLADLNLDPRHRVAAGMGVAVVRSEQEQLMAVAWEQLAAHERDEQARRREELSLEVGQALTERHIAPLNTERLAQVAAPINAAALRSSAVSENGQGGTGVGRTSTARTQSVAFRRLRRRVLGADGTRRMAARVDGPGQATTVERDPRKEALLADLGPATSILPETIQTQETSEFPTPAAGQVPNEAEVPVRFAPAFGRPMYEALHGHFPDALLPGMEHIPPDTIALLEPNAGFVEAFMVGLNHEMSRELLWREYPVDRQGTFFRHFWDRGPWEWGPEVLRREKVGTSPRSRIGRRLPPWARTPSGPAARPRSCSCCSCAVNSFAAILVRSSTPPRPDGQKAGGVSHYRGWSTRDTRSFVPRATPTSRCSGSVSRPSRSSVAPTNPIRARQAGTS